MAAGAELHVGQNHGGVGMQPVRRQQDNRTKRDIHLGRFGDDRTVERNHMICNREDYLFDKPDDTKFGANALNLSSLACKYGAVVFWDFQPLLEFRERALEHGGEGTRPWKSCPENKHWFVAFHIPSYFYPSIFSA
ncbi:MAG: hypothetical protein CL912_08320 [Deltaproteobacteria bacterium]|nr:hypothetical protein [Deltaproteobacteria bacterium]